MTISTKINHPINEDRDFFGSTIRTRRKFYDEKILDKELDPELNMYHIPDNPKLVIDIGAHIGGTALLAAKKGATVLAFEPELYNFETLEYNVEKNNLCDKINCINKGVGKSGEMCLIVHNRNSGIALPKEKIVKVIDADMDNFQIVDSISINDVFKNYNISHCDLLKMDCEGCEEEIIKDLDDELVNKIDIISVELHGVKSIMKELLRILSKWYVCEESNVHKHEWICKKNVNF